MALTKNIENQEYRINCARLKGTMRNHTLTEFKNFLLELGLNKYEKKYLPSEL